MAYFLHLVHCVQSPYGIATETYVMETDAMETTFMETAFLLKDESVVWICLAPKLMIHHHRFNKP